jgi:hypothetical protein
MNNKNLLFSLTKKDFIIEYFNPGKNGGQNANKIASACRIRHPASGAIGECKEERTQKPNRERAFKRLTETPKFKKWLKLEIAKQAGFLDGIEQKVERAMKQVKIEVHDKKGNWQEVPDEYFNEDDENYKFMRDFAYTRE